MNGLTGEQQGIQISQSSLFNKTTTMIRQTLFSGGEVDPINWRRTDLSLYTTGCQSLLNCTVSTTALVQKRQGSLRMGGVTDKITDPAHIRLFPFIDQDGNYYPVVANFDELDSLMRLSIFQADMTFIQTVDVNGIETVEQFDTMAYSNVNDDIVFTQNSVFPFRLMTVYPVETGSFSVQDLNIYPFPAYDFGLIDYNTFTVANDGVSTFSFTGLSSDPGFTTDWIGGVIIGQGASADTPLGYAIITDVTPWTSMSGTVTFTYVLQLPFASPPQTGPNIGNQYSVRQPAFSDTLGYPAVVNYYQNRLFFASTPSLPLTLFASQTNLPTDFDVGVGNDSDALIYTLGNSNSGPIVALNGGKQLEIYTEYFEYVCPQDQSVALTPSTFAIRQQSAYGSKGICQPISYDNDSYYISRTGNSLIKFEFEGIGLAYKSTNISIQSTHLVKNPINRVLVRGAGGGSVKSQDNTVYYLNPDNTITAFQFSDMFTLAALTPITFQDDVEIIDIAPINNKLYILKFYRLSGQYLMEALTDVVGSDETPLRLDCSTQKTVDESGVVTNLDDYKGYTVDVFLNNQDFGQYLVPDSGEITVDNMGVTGDAYVGLIYPVEIIPMFIFSGPNDTDYLKKLTQVFIDYFQSLNFYVKGRLVWYQNFKAIQQGLPLAPRSGTYKQRVVTGYNTDYTFPIVQNSPFDLVITAISYQIISTII